MAKLNCSIALDNFGNGYSSFGDLARININTLRIDKLFVEHVAQSSKSKLVIEAFIDMGMQLGVEVCAEGEEIEEQATLIKDSGCHHLQGFLYSKPSPIEQLFVTNPLLLYK